ncbi:hypothetical protein BQ8794_70525 [Mesorhizobium prunaredense]|uniref:Uncharacterized protein n=1 Tax=Mesorhizobium prunaredense TaxID=1631249 RepID=A0A1R3VIC7_9HYPH|nr:hypothetical protein BQ8794_70525 [Mesorhizobium prunaredense]
MPVNAEMEHQTAKDTTTGAQQPMGARGATVADTLGGSADAADQQSRSGEHNTQRADHLESPRNFAWRNH